MPPNARKEIYKLHISNKFPDKKAQLFRVKQLKIQCDVKSILMKFSKRDEKSNYLFVFLVLCTYISMSTIHITYDVIITFIWVRMYDNFDLL